jgi:hypothetical protein
MMTIMGKELTTSIAVREAREFQAKLRWEAIGEQLFMLATLGLMAFFGLSVVWIVATGLLLTTGTVTAILLECVFRLDAGRAYVELWTSDATELLARIDEKTG